MKRKTKTAKKPKIKVAKRIVKNGIMLPLAGSIADVIFRIADRITSQKKRPALRSEVLPEAKKAGVLEGTASVRFCQWCKFHKVKGRWERGEDSKNRKTVKPKAKKPAKAKPAAKKATKPKAAKPAPKPVKKVVTKPAAKPAKKAAPKKPKLAPIVEIKPPDSLPPPPVACENTSDPL